ncbi:unnamed protein product [Aphanomyces euteiches]
MTSENDTPSAAPINAPPGVTTANEPLQPNNVTDSTGSLKYQALPNQSAAPIYDGSTAAEKKTFMREYQQYWLLLISLQHQGFRPLILPIGSCIKDSRRRLIAKYDVCKPIDQFSEDDWKQYFNQGNDIGMIDCTRVDRQMGTLQLNTRLTDADSRISNLVHSMHLLLEKLSMEFMADDEQKRVIGYLTAALAPQALKSKVQTELGRQSNKYLKSDLQAFIAWLREAMASFMRWESEQIEKVHFAAKTRGDPVTKAVSFRAPTPNRSHDSNRTPRGAENSYRQSVRTAVPSNGNNRNMSGRGARQSRDDYGGRGGLRSRGSSSERPLPPSEPICSSCGGTHQRHACPTRSSVNSIILRIGEPGQSEGSTVITTVEEKVTLDGALLDTGADVTIVNHALIDALKDNGHHVVLRRCPPHALEPFSGSPILVQDSITFDRISLDTSAGPLLLRQLTAWVVDDQNDQPRLIIARPVMEKLGYSLDAILATAC